LAKIISPNEFKDIKTPENSYTKLIEWLNKNTYLD
jgi:hypothetical protein